MTGLPHEANELLARVARRRAGLLILDYDGTLAPFQSDRMKAVPYEGVNEVVEKIADAATPRADEAAAPVVAVVSGRPIAELEALFPVAHRVEMWGAHGWEVRHPDGRREDTKPAAAVTRFLDKVEAAADKAGVRPANRERKIASIVLHERSLKNAKERDAYESAAAAIEKLKRPDDISLLRFDGGLEVRSHTRTKGHAVRSFLDRHPQHVGATAYLGDDTTDEDAFRELRDDGLGILVRTEPRPTAAGCRLIPPDELLVFLRQWAAAIRPTAPAKSP